MIKRVLKPRDLEFVVHFIKSKSFKRPNVNIVKESDPTHDYMGRGVDPAGVLRDCINVITIASR